MSKPSAPDPSASVDGGYSFRQVVPGDFPMLRGWLCEPHVRDWWGDPDAEVELIRESLDFDWLDAMIASVGAKPFAYVQCYDIFAEDYRPFPDQPAGTRAVDQFIGPPDMIERGHGRRFLRALLAERFRQGAPRIVTDPDPANARAIACYRGAGFSPLGTRDLPDGRVLLMAHDAPGSLK